MWIHKTAKRLFSRGGGGARVRVKIHNQMNHSWQTEGLDFNFQVARTSTTFSIQPSALLKEKHKHITNLFKSVVVFRNFIFPEFKLSIISIQSYLLV